MTGPFERKRMGTDPTRPSSPLELVTLAPRAAQPLHRQLCDQLRELIMTGAVGAGARLPSIRGFAAALGISRNTVIAALDQLAAEGLVQPRQGSGTRVTASIVIGLTAPARRETERSGLSARGALMAAQSRVRTIPGRTAFHPGMPDLSEFPFKTWSRLLARHARLGGEDLFGYHYIAGHPHLREAIAGFLGTMRRVRCTPDQVVVTTGGQAAIDLLARLLLAEGDTVWMEEPGYLGARGALLAAGARTWPLPVGRDGWRLPGPAAPPPRLIYLTPSCQHPLGVTMPLEQRLAVLEMARAADAWVIEDDFDGEYTFRGQPQPSMQGLIGGARVIYVGTFAKTLFPSMRIGFMVVPPEMVEPVKVALSLTGQFAPLFLQAALADFIERGSFFRHLNRMRRLYGRRRAVLLGLIDEHLGELLAPIDGRTGIQVAAEFRVPADDRAAAARAAAVGMHLAPLSIYFAGEPKTTGLVIGYAAVGEAAMRRTLPLLRASLGA
jgi:GntR family transcriptional regulator / MocR family aminotransferase